MKMRKFFIVLLFYFFTTFTPLFASNIGTTILPVLLEIYSVRSTALGKTFVSNSKGIGSVFESSIGLYSVDSPQLSFFYNRSFIDVGFGYLAFAYPFRKIVLGFGVLNMQTDTFDTILVIERKDEKGEQIETIIERSYVRGQSDWIYNLGAGLNLSKKLNIGFTLKQYNSTLIEQYTASGVAFDAGARLSVGHFDFGFSFNNNGSKAGYKETKFNLPQYTQIGLNFNTKRERFFSNFDIALEYESRVHEDLNFLHTGIEWLLPVGWIHPVNEVSFRVGYITEVSDNTRQRISAGFGIEFSSILVDYSIVPHSKLGTSHFFSLTYEFPVPPIELREIEKEQ